MYDECGEHFRRLFAIDGIRHPKRMGADDIIKVFDEDLGDALRYLCGPPISKDDLKTLAAARSVTVKSLSKDGAVAALAICEIIKATADPRRFPWIVEDRDPTDDEIEKAIAISAALNAEQRLQTWRRNAAKKAQEEAVKEFLRAIGFEDAPTPKKIETLATAPPTGHFCGECTLGSRKVDVPVRLFDGRILAIECKVSYSALNSVKRVNNDAAAKAKYWLDQFGPRGVVPTAMLSGVFKVSNLMQAQDMGLTLFWSHEMDAMAEFIESTKG